MRKIIILALIVSLSSLLPVNVNAEDAPGNAAHPPQNNNHEPVPPPTSALGEGGIIAVTVSILGLIALAASSSSGDATPATTTHAQ